MNKSKGLFGLVLFFLSCTNSNTGTTPDNKSNVKDSAIQPKTVRNIEASLWKADSLQILYYDNPDGDSLRYSRFFTYTETGDTERVGEFLKEVDQVFVQQPAVKDCRSEGKLFLLQGETILKTVYFSTRNDSCAYMYFIKDGSFIYFPVTEKAKLFFKENRNLAKKP